MTLSFACEESPSSISSKRSRRPSLYAAFTVACVVQAFKDRLRCRSKSNSAPSQRAIKNSFSCKSQCSQNAKDYDYDYDSGRGTPTSETDPPFLNLPLNRYSSNFEFVIDRQKHTTLGRRSTRRGSYTRILLDKLDSFTQPQSASTATIATDDAAFLQYDPRHNVASKDVTTLGNILDLTTALLGRLQRCFGSLDECAETLGPNHGAESGSKKTAANLEHMLRCLQFAALEALTYCYLKVVEAEFIHWHSYWQRRWQTSDAWFAEWPSGRRPLSTTWPWNVRPSLLVLWGVCWMFYGNDGMPRKPQAAEFFSDDFRTGQSPHVPPHLHPNSNAEGWTITASNNLQPLFESHPGAAPRSANRISDYYTLPAFSAGVSSSPYISTRPSTSSASFGTLTDFWPQNQGINSGIDATSNFTYAPNYSDNISPRLPNPWISSQPRSVPALEAADSVNLYAAQYNQAVRHEPRGNATGGEPSLGRTNSNMPGYPSPHSDMSDLRVSPCPSVFAGTSVTPATVPYTTTSRASSTYESPQSARSEEPTRNDEGLMYCSHTKCAEEPPIFTRKCEWSKHMDKHNRPYICEERGCEKINGFTYSGGLLRHQREVHRQHGGPKASCMCPHRDCKRSTGAGFSRRENLVEHLRRVHRGVGDESTDSPLPKGPEKKRRRAANDEDRAENVDPSEEPKRRKIVDDNDAVKDQNESKDLQAKVRQLELELLQKDERLRKLEETVERLARSQPNL